MRLARVLLLPLFVVMALAGAARAVSPPELVSSVRDFARAALDATDDGEGR